MQTDRFNLFVIRLGRKLNRNIPHIKLMPSIVDNQIHIKRQKTIFSQFGQISITAWALQIQKSLSFHLKNIHPFLCSTNYPHKMLWLEILFFLLSCKSTLLENANNYLQTHKLLSFFLTKSNFPLHLLHLYHQYNYVGHQIKFGDFLSL